jgi:hypothetical protein
MMPRTARLAIYGLLAGGCLLSTGCYDAVMEGLTGGLQAGISGGIQAIIEGVVGLFVPAG